MNERPTFDAWLAVQSGRVTGWMVWRASLAARDYPAENSRGAFDRWLAQALVDSANEGREWGLFDAWRGAADYARRIMLGSLDATFCARCGKRIGPESVHTCTPSRA